eukprot:2786228-Pleurochrysis_carterae.AAC.1
MPIDALIINALGFSSSEDRTSRRTETAQNAKGEQGVNRTVSEGKGGGKPSGEKSKEVRRQKPDLVGELVIKGHNTLVSGPRQRSTSSGRGGDHM